MFPANWQTEPQHQFFDSLSHKNCSLSESLRHSKQIFCWTHWASRIVPHTSQWATISVSDSLSHKNSRSESQSHNNSFWLTEPQNNGFWLTSHKIKVFGIESHKVTVFDLLSHKNYFWLSHKTIFPNSPGPSTVGGWDVDSNPLGNVPKCFLAENNKQTVIISYTINSTPSPTAFFRNLPQSSIIPCLHMFFDW